MNFDAMGSYYGAVNDMLETDMEANVKPVTQTITTDPKTGEQMMTVKGRPQDLSAANPNTPTVTPAGQPPAPQPNLYRNLADSASMTPVAYQPTAPVAPAVPQQPPVQQTPPAGQPPVGATRQPLMAPASQPAAPDQTYQRMIQAESGGQNYTPSGAPLTSPAGAMFAAQVMPATAQNPGYGVRPAQAQTPEEYNRVGQDYYNAMLNKFGNPTAAAAAYNAGPGRVQQNMAANNGQLNISQLPQETQQYLQRVQPGQAPGAQPQPMIAGTPSSDVGLTPTEQAIRQQQTPDQRYANDFIKVQNNPAELARLRYDQNAPEWVRTLASQKELQDLKHRDETSKVEQKIKTAIETGDGRTIASMMNPRGKDKDEGSIAKAFLFSLIGFQSGAQAEVEKMGLKDKWDISRLGDSDVTVRYNPRGEAKEAIYTSGPNAGQRVSDADLEMLHGQGAAGGKVKSDVSTQDVERNGVAGRVVTEHRGGRTQTYVESGGKRYEYDTSWQPRSIATAASKADYGLITDLRKKFGTDAISAMTEYQKVKGPLDERSRSEFLNLYGFNAAMPSGKTPAPAQLPPTAGVPGAGPVAPAIPGAPGAAQQNQVPGAGTNMRTAPGPVAPTPVQAPAAAPAPTAAPTTAPAAAPSDLTKPIATLQQETAAEKPNIEQAAKNRKQAEKIFPFVTQIRDLVDKSTGSGIGSRIDDAGNFIGYTTSGAEAIAAIRPLASKILMGVERFEGPQSNIDVQSYKEAAGQLSDPKVPAKQKQAAFNTIIDIMERNAPEMDWSQFRQGGGTTTKAGAPKSGTTKTINGVTYEYDGRGWKKSAGI